MSDVGDTRNDAGSDGGDPQALAHRVDELEGKLERTQIRQRALIHALARITGFASAEIERLVG